MILLLTTAIDVVVGVAHPTKKLYQLLLNTPFSPDGKYIITLLSLGESTAYIWDLLGRQVSKIEDKEQMIFDIGFSSKSNIAITSFKASREYKLWNLLGRSFKAIPGTYNDISNANFSPDGKYLVTISIGYDGKTYTDDIHLWEISTN